MLRRNSINRNLSLNSLHFRFDSLLSGDCHAVSRRCSWNQPSVKRRFESFLKYYDTSVQKLVFLLYLTPKNKRQEINLEGFSVCVFRRLILGHTKATSGGFGFHNQKIFPRWPPSDGLRSVRRSACRRFTLALPVALHMVTMRWKLHSHAPKLNTMRKYTL